MPIFAPFISRLVIVSCKRDHLTTVDRTSIYVYMCAKKVLRKWDLWLSTCHMTTIYFYVQRLGGLRCPLLVRSQSSATMISKHLVYTILVRCWLSASLPNLLCFYPNYRIGGYGGAFRVLDWCVCIHLQCTASDIYQKSKCIAKAVQCSHKDCRCTLYIYIFVNENWIVQDIPVMVKYYDP